MRYLILTLLLTASLAVAEESCQRAEPLDGETLVPVIGATNGEPWVYWAPVEQSNAVVCFGEQGCVGEDWDRPVYTADGQIIGYLLKDIQITQKTGETGT